MKDIKPCPFCGGKADIFCNYSRNGYLVFVKCGSCSAQSGVKLSTESPVDDHWANVPCTTVIENWNRRYAEELADFAAWLAEKRETDTSEEETNAGD